jgi:hypothetical protein
MSASFNRRTILRGVPAAAAAAGAIVASAALALPTTAAVHSGDTALLSLIAEWQAARVASNDNPIEYERVEDDPFLQRLWDIEDEIARTEPETAAGFAAKFLILTAYGDFTLDGRAACLFIDALNLAPASIGQTQDGYALREFVGKDGFK